ncbi:hypothetical protein, conserved [Plasmodium gonderi]|uniref:GOLD domain-containing protein n=1 Tax=Plasmodium gonderi TaxID=77519 RepID=A0A1Y1JBG1_PLAGO|nr:hypothetical protein, conserved [Plasmodium gonderi]GAW79836.1 hypothetical protein, conserved [Plasmodium gonderi]
MRRNCALVVILLVVLLSQFGIDKVWSNNNARNNNNNRNSKNAKGKGGMESGKNDMNKNNGGNNNKSSVPKGGKKKVQGSGSSGKGQEKEKNRNDNNNNFDKGSKKTVDNEDEYNFMDELNKFEKMFHENDFENEENEYENYGKGGGSAGGRKIDEGNNNFYDDFDEFDNSRGYNDMKPNANDYQYFDNEETLDSDDDLTNIWNKNMQNFEPSTLLTFEIQGNSEEYLFEEITSFNTYFRGVFYSNNESDDNKIQFFIRDPDGTIIYKKEASEGIFYFYTEKNGIYTITLKNSKWVGKKLTTVALGIGESPSLKSEHIKDFTNFIDKIVSETKKLKNEIKYLSSKHMSHIEKMKKITNKAFLYCFIKLFVLIFLSLFTIYYIKNLVSNKRVL